MKTITFYNEFTIADAAQQPETIFRALNSIIGNRRIIIYGAAHIGKTLIRCLQKLDLDVAHIIDRDYSNIVSICGRTVEMPDILHSVAADTNRFIIIVAVSERTSLSISSDLEKTGLDYLVVTNGQHITDCVQSAICADNHKNGMDVSHAFCSDCSILDNICPVLRNRGLDLLTDDIKDDGEMKCKNMTMIGYILGNVCTLNCKHCCESVHLFSAEQRAFVNADAVIMDIKRLSDVCKCITIAEFVGGEPFSHPELSKIISKTLSIRNIAYLRVFTNGTVLPNEDLLKTLSNPRVAVYISNYTGMMTDKMSRILSQTKESLTENKISFAYGGNKKWFEFSSYSYRDDSIEELSMRFNECFLHNCNRLHDGTLYVCPHHYAGTRLGIIPESNTVRIHELNDSELKKALDEFKQMTYTEACKFCDMPYNAPIIIPGNQK